MRVYRTFATAGLSSLFLGVTAGASATSSNIVYILDASNSMWGQIEGTAKIETARTALGTLLENIDTDTAPGLIVYGHRSEGDCGDIELLAPIGQSTAAQLTQALGALQPKGKTPIADALAAAGESFPTNDAVNQVVLISDGIETCGGDPCAVAGQLAASGVQTKVHAIGFDVDDEARAQLECIADAGGGMYFNAANAAEFEGAVTEATQVAMTQPEPEPEPERAFFDDFDPDMSEQWAVSNPNPDAFIAENGTLLLLASGVGGFATAEQPNVMSLPGVLPDGDWDAVLTFTGEFATGRDSLWFGLRNDAENFLGAQFWTKRDCCGCSNIVISNVKMSSGTQTRFDSPLWGKMGCGSFSERKHDAYIDPLASQPSKITLHKRGRSYHVSMELTETDEEGNPIVIETDRLTSLRSPGELSLTAGRWENKRGGEMLISVDSVEVFSIPE